MSEESAKVRTRRFASLRSRFALVVMLAVIPGFIVSVIAVRDERNSSRVDAQRDARTIAASTAARYDSLLRESHSLLQALSNLPAELYGADECSDVITTIVSDSTTYEDFQIVNAEGDVVCTSASSGVSENVAGELWFVEAMSTDAFVVGATAEGATPTYPIITTSLGHDYRGQRWILASRFSLEQLGDVVTGAAFPAGAAVTLLDPDNVVMYRGPGTSEFIGRSVTDTDVVQQLREAEDGTGVITAAGADGRRRLYSYESLSAPAGAALYAGIPTSVAYAQATRDFRIRLIWLAVGALLALLIALSIADLTIGRRIRSLVGLTQRFGAGDLTARASVGTGDEVASLGNSLNTMASELQARDHERAQLLSKLVDASEEERRRIAGDVHDDSIQVMSAQVMGLQLLRRRVEDPELRARIQRLEESGREATARLRDLVFYLHSPMLETHGLASTLDLLLDRTFEGESVEWRVDSSLPHDPPPASRDTAYRIAQEAIGNTRRHARASHVVVDLSRDGSDLVLAIVDDGSGFAPQELEDRPGHLGLRAASERAEAVGGVITIESAVGQGTRFVCRLPWLFNGTADRSNGQRPPPQ